MHTHLRKGVCFVVFTAVFGAVQLMAVDEDFAVQVNRFKAAVASGRKEAIAKLVVYPLHRETPIPGIKSAEEMIERFRLKVDDRRAITRGRAARLPNIIRDLLFCCPIFRFPLIAYRPFVSLVFR